MPRLRVLVTDDELGMRVGVTRSLRDFSVTVPDISGTVEFEVDQADTGELALEKIESKPPDILLLDQKLPGISGLEVLKQIEKTQPDMITIMITAYATIETAITATKLGGFDYLPKPFTPNELKRTIRKAANQLLLVRHARQLAEEKRRVRFEFIRVLGHELKAPLNAVAGYMQILQEGKVDNNPETRNQMIERSMIRIESMRKLIMDLLDMTQIEAGQRQRSLETIKLYDIAELAIETMIPDAEKRGITIELNCNQDLIMDADRSEMEIVMNNLVSNAVKYNKDHGKVTVKITAEADMVTVKVSDTGIGMTDTEAAKLFNDFTRIKNAQTRHILGSGLGLSILKKITQLYHGDVTVKSKPNEGTCFTATFQQHHLEDKDTNHGD